jgi:hypothetical protein
MGVKQVEIQATMRVVIFHWIDIKNYTLLDEPPDADPHVRWCERGRLTAAPYSIENTLSKLIY